MGESRSRQERTPLCPTDISPKGELKKREESRSDQSQYSGKKDSAVLCAFSVVKRKLEEGKGVSGLKVGKSEH